MEKPLFQNKTYKMHDTFLTHFRSFCRMNTSRHLEKEDPEGESIPQTKHSKTLFAWFPTLTHDCPMKNNISTTKISTDEKREILR